jgi:hypothetical protein
LFFFKFWCDSLGVVYSKRALLFNGTFMGSREIRYRRKPWNNSQRLSWRLQKSHREVHKNLIKCCCCLECGQSSLSISLCLFLNEIGYLQLIRTFHFYLFRCWHADPSQRPTMQEVCDILEQMIKNSKNKWMKRDEVKWNYI